MNYKPKSKPLVQQRYFDVRLANAQRIKNVPGRKTDVSDSEWIAKLLRHGLIERSFVPSLDLRELRELVRLRKNWIGNLTAGLSFREHTDLTLEQVLLSVDPQVVPFIHTF